MKITIPPRKKDVSVTVNPLVVDVKHAAALLNVSDRTVWKLAKGGTLKTVRVGGRVFFPIKAIESFVAGEPVQN